MGAPLPQEVAAFLGQGDRPETVDLAAEHLPVVTEMVRGYTRGAGFYPDSLEPGPELAHVIVSAAARSVSNPHSVRDETVGDFSVRRTVFTGFTLAELAVLHRHRRQLA